MADGWVGEVFIRRLLVPPSKYVLDNDNELKNSLPRTLRLKWMSASLYCLFLLFGTPYKKSRLLHSAYQNILHRMHSSLSLIVLKPMPHTPSNSLTLLWPINLPSICKLAYLSSRYTLSIEYIVKKNSQTKTIKFGWKLDFFVIVLLSG